MSMEKAIYHMTYKGQTSLHHGLRVYKYPEIEEGEAVFKSYDLPGIDGTLYMDKKKRKDAEITYVFFCESKKDRWREKYRNVRQWILGPGSNKLIESDDPGYFWIVKKAVLKSSEREYNRFGTITVSFVCYPYQYVSGCDTPIEPAWDSLYLIASTGDAVLTADGSRILPTYRMGTLYNQYAVSHPVYHLSGNGEGYFAVNGYQVEVQVHGSLTIDTERKAAYRDKTMANTSITGDYEEMYLQEGENRIQISNNLNLAVSPMWRCL